MALKPTMQKQFLVLLDQLKETYWSKVTAPKETRDVAEYNDGQTGKTRKVLGFTNTENITLSKAFDPVADKAIVDWYSNRKKDAGKAEKFSISIQPINADYQGSVISGGITITLTGCQVVSFKAPDVDRLGTGMSMIELEVCYDDISF